jgi:phosphoesterase RecJ-like protein
MTQREVGILSNKIKSAKSILIIAHDNPDGDAIGSAVGLYHIIKENFGKIASITWDGIFQGNLDFMLEKVDTAHHASEMSPDVKFDLAIAVDIGDLHLMARALPFFESAKYKIKIDHHVVVNSYADLNIEKTISANAEQILNISREMGWKINKDAATALYTGIYTDTGRFSHSDGADVIRAAADLVDLGADYRKIAGVLTEDSRESVLANARIITNAEFRLGGALAIAEADLKTYKDLSGDKGSPAMRKLRSIREVRVVTLLKEVEPNNVRISFRSKGVQINELAEKFGGGGHKFAAAFRLHMPLPQAREFVITELEKFYNERSDDQEYCPTCSVKLSKK